MEWTSEDHAFVREVLGRYRDYLSEYGGMTVDAARFFAAEDYASSHRHYLIFVRAFAGSTISLQLNRERLLDLSVAGYCVMRMAVAIDRAVDDLRGPAMRFAFDNQQLILLLLAKHLDHNQKLWRRHYVVMDQYWRAAELERANYELGDPDAITLLDEIRLYKSCPLHMILDWLEALAPGHVHPNLYEALNLTSKVWQILDDIKDFRDDLVSGQMTLLIYEVESWLSSHDIKLREQPHEMQQRLMMMSPVVDRHLEEARELSLKAIEWLRQHQAGRWIEPMEEALRLVDQYAGTIARARLPLVANG